MIFLIIVLAIIVANTIKPTISFLRRYTMKYLGATDHFRKRPFLFEGIILGICVGDDFNCFNVYI